jgi:hypothetical protein
MGQNQSLVRPMFSTPPGCSLLTGVRVFCQLVPQARHGTCHPFHLLHAGCSSTMFVFVGGIQPSVQSKTVDLECPGRCLQRTRPAAAWWWVSIISAANNPRHQHSDEPMQVHNSCCSCRTSIFGHTVYGVQQMLLGNHSAAAAASAVCHRSSTQEKTLNQVLSLFFVPLFTVHKGQPYRVCPQCGWDSKHSRPQGLPSVLLQGIAGSLCTSAGLSASLPLASQCTCLLLL